MDEMMVVFVGLGLFLIAGLFGSLGIAAILKGKRQQGVVLLGIGIAHVLLYIIALLFLL